MYNKQTPAANRLPAIAIAALRRFEVEQAHQAQAQRHSLSHAQDSDSDSEQNIKSVVYPLSFEHTPSLKTLQARGSIPAFRPNDPAVHQLNLTL